MNKLKLIISTGQFWIYFLVSSIAIFALESLFLGLWTIPVIDYRISYMEEVTEFDLAFTGLFAITFGFGTALFLLMRKWNKIGCAIGSSSGIFALFTLLCPICPVFFLSYFGLSASVMIFAPYFWWIRLAAIILLLVGIIILLRSIQLQKPPKLNPHKVFHKFAIIAVALLFINNQAIANQIGQDLIGPQSRGEVSLSGDFAKDVAALVTPSALPFYGPELGLNFSGLSEINASIKKMGVMAPKQGSNPIELNDEEMKRYITIGTEPLVTCEFCCGVKTLVREDGTPTCGCAHSIAMRGTAAYLIRNYPGMTNAEISYELMRQKGLYFPKQMQERMAGQLAGEQENFTADIKYLTQNIKPSELTELQKKAKEKGFVPDVDASMVGGC